MGSTGQSNTQSTVWALASYRALGDEGRPGTWDFFLHQQAASGAFECWGDRSPCAQAWATMEAVVGLNGFHPLPAFRPVAVAVPTNATIHSPFAVEALGEEFTDATWSWSGGGAAGLTADLTLGLPGPMRIDVHATGPGVHGRTSFDVMVEPADAEPEQAAEASPAEAVPDEDPAGPARAPRGRRPRAPRPTGWLRRTPANRKRRTTGRRHRPPSCFFSWSSPSPPSSREKAREVGTTTATSPPRAARSFCDVAVTGMPSYLRRFRPAPRSFPCRRGRTTGRPGFGARRRAARPCRQW
jgi:hypothetical protein